MKRSKSWSIVAVTSLVSVLLSLGGCSGAKDDKTGDGAPSGGGTGAAGTHSTSGAGGGSSAGAGGGAAGSGSNAGSSGGSAGGGAGSSGDAGTDPAEMLDPDVDWTALKIVYTTMYSAYDGKHTFQVPAHVDGTAIGASDWSAIPKDAVIFEDDPDTGGVLMTVQKAVDTVTIAARAGMIGGTAPLHITKATPEEWQTGNARYNNGVEYDIPDLDFASLILDPNWMPPTPPPNLACVNCHTSGAKYFEVQHSPTQAARYSDQDLITIFTTGKKPPGVGFRVLPPMLGAETAEQLYASFHTWDATDEEQKGLIVYLRSLTPVGQGDILLPDGTYVAPGTPIDAGTP